MGFWAVPGTSKSDPDPPKSMILLCREHDFQKIMFFLLKIEVLKKQHFSCFLEPQKLAFLTLFGARFGDVFLFFCCSVSGRPKGSHFVPFWNHFGLILGAFWDAKSKVRESIFENVLVVVESAFGPLRKNNW